MKFGWRRQRVEAQRRERNGAQSISLTIVCTDVVDFTRITERLGDGAAFEVMQRLAVIVRRETRRYGGKELELQGDGFLLGFSSPAGGVAAAVSIQRELERTPIPAGDSALRMRIAAHTGSVLRDSATDNFFGANMIVPYRLLDRTSGGEIVLSSELRAHVEHQWALGPISEFIAKGFSRALHFCHLEWSSPGEFTSALALAEAETSAPRGRHAVPHAA